MRYSKRQIVEAINYWNKQLKRLNESGDYTVAARLIVKGKYVFADLFPNHFHTQHCADSMLHITTIAKDFNDIAKARFGKYFERLVFANIAEVNEQAKNHSAPIWGWYEAGLDDDISEPLDEIARQNDDEIKRLMEKLGKDMSENWEYQKEIRKDYGIDDNDINY